jgi:phosphate-selective porin OprO/OprP
MKRSLRHANRVAAVAAIITASCYVPSGWAQTQNQTPDINTLLQRINELEQKVNSLEHKQDVTQETVNERVKTQPTISLGGLGAEGLIIKSADSNFVMNIHGYAQVDGRFFPNDHVGTFDQFLLRRVRPIVEGTVFDKFDYRLMADLASTSVSGSSAANNGILDDAYVNARPWKEFQLQIGKYKSPLGLERLQSTADLMFVETGFATELTPNYDLGISLHNSFFAEPIGYSIGVYNGAGDAASDDNTPADDGKDVVARVFAQPFLNTNLKPLKHLGFGVAASEGYHAGTLPSYKTDGQQTFFSYATTAKVDGDQYRLDPQAYYYWGPFGVEAEYILSSQRVRATTGAVPLARFNNTAWQAEASYFVTGEENSFKPTSKQHVVPLQNVFNGGWGAWEVVGRLEQFSAGRDQFNNPSFVAAGSARDAFAWGFGVNWYLNANVKLNLDYDQTTFHDLAAGNNPVTKQTQHEILTRVQFQF